MDRPYGGKLHNILQGSCVAGLTHSKQWISLLYLHNIIIILKSESDDI